MNKSKQYEIYNQSCYGLNPLEENSIDALVTDPPYGISYQNNYWDKDLPKREIWEDSLRVLKGGSVGLVFSFVRLEEHGDGYDKFFYSAKSKAKCTVIQYTSYFKTCRDDATFNQTC